MRRAITILLGACVCLIVAIPALACLWDYDTLEMERQRFPDVLELITGKFLRHSEEFYRWRIQDREKKLQQEPDRLEYYDDLAVAYEKIGNHDKAIETILLKDKKKPNQYETLANLGTFYFHKGELEKGLPYIDKAIAINPDAHFGREVYQKLLVEYVIANSKNGKPVLPLCKVERHHFKAIGFHSFILQKHEIANGADADRIEVEKATKGILGMMKFGNYDSPILLEALGDLLLSGGQKDAKQLASRAYLKASFAVRDSEQSAAYRENAKNALHQQTGTTLEELATDFKLELQDANDWYERVKADEIEWIKSNSNPEEKFAAKYYSEPAIRRDFEFPFNPAYLIVLVFVLLYGMLRYRRHRVQRSASNPS